ncbi:MAG: phosphotransferase, partial [Proteobacteria bacterium]|nr:phosphotransferase [Pseudomonadota bacterium]
FIEGPVLGFSPFQASKSYISITEKSDSRMKDSLPRFSEINRVLEANVSNIKLASGHNDLLPANFLDDGKRLWLLDWEYAGFSAALFDLANLSSNNQLSEKQDDWILENYYQTAVTDHMRLRLKSMKCASLLRETLWSIVQEFHSDLDFDYVKYTEDNLERFNQAYNDLK